MKISLVTLSFNQREYLQQALDSVLEQGYEDLEYVVVDPGSADGSRELIESYKTSISRILFEPDRGAAEGLNKGFSVASGDVFGFLNADDFLAPGSLQKVCEFFTHKPDCEIGFGDGYVVDETGRKVRHYRAKNFTVQRYFYGGASWLQQSTFFRSRVFTSLRRFNEGNRTCWDGEFFVTSVSDGARVGYIQEDLGYFRIHAKSISGTGNTNSQYRLDTKRVFEQIYGRTWGPSDTLLRLWYRTSRFLSIPGIQ